MAKWKIVYKPLPNDTAATEEVIDADTINSDNAGRLIIFGKSSGLALPVVGEKQPAQVATIIRVVNVDAIIEVFDISSVRSSILN